MKRLHPLQFVKIVNSSHVVDPAHSDSKTVAEHNHFVLIILESLDGLNNVYISGNMNKRPLKIHVI